jgi:hypothetical protein
MQHQQMPPQQQPQPGRRLQDKRPQSTGSTVSTTSTAPTTPTTTYQAYGSREGRRTLVGVFPTRHDAQEALLGVDSPHQVVPRTPPKPTQRPRSLTGKIGAALRSLWPF